MSEKRSSNEILLEMLQRLDTRIDALDAVQAALSATVFRMAVVEASHARCHVVQAKPSSARRSNTGFPYYVDVPSSDDEHDD